MLTTCECKKTYCRTFITFSFKFWVKNNIQIQVSVSNQFFCIFELVIVVFVPCEPKWNQTDRTNEASKLQHVAVHFTKWKSKFSNLRRSNMVGLICVKKIGSLTCHVIQIETDNSYIYLFEDQNGKKMALKSTKQ